MTRNEDELEGREELSDRQRWAVNRYEARAGRFQRERRRADPWEAFDRAEIEEENRRFGRT